MQAQIAHKSTTEHIAIFTDKIIHNFAAAISFCLIKIRATQSVQNGCQFFEPVHALASRTAPRFFTHLTMVVHE